MGPLLMFQSTSLSMDDWINLEQGQKEFSLLKPDFQLPEYIHLMTVENWDAPSTDVNADMQGSLFEGYRQLVGCSLICQTDLIYNFNNHFLGFNLKQKQLFTDNVDHATFFCQDFFINYPAEVSDVLLRFENLLENTEGPTDDTTWTTNVELPDDIFVGFNIGDMVELSLGGDRPIEDVINQFKWTKTEQNVSNYLQKYYIKNHTIEL